MKLKRPSAAFRMPRTSYAMTERLAQMTSDIPHVAHIETFHKNARSLSASVCDCQFRLDTFHFTWHQADIIIAVDGREDTVSCLFTNGFHPNHQRGVAGPVSQIGCHNPLVALLPDGGCRFQTDLWQLANGAIIPGFAGAQKKFLETTRPWCVKRSRRKCT